MLGQQHRDTAISLNQVGFTYSSCKQYEQALLFLRQALQILQSMFNEEQHDIADVLYNIGNVYYNQGQYKQALSEYQQALNIQRITLGERHPDTVSTQKMILILGRLSKPSISRDDEVRYFVN